MSIRKITKKEATVYTLLESHSAGRSRFFNNEKFNWDEARFKYASWYRRRSVGEFYVENKHLELCKNEVPELYDDMLKYSQASDNLQKAMIEFERTRSAFNRQAFELVIKDKYAVHKAYQVLSPEEEALLVEYGSSPAKSQELVDKFEGLVKELDDLPKIRSNAKQRNALKDQIKQLQDIFSILNTKKK